MLTRLRSLSVIKNFIAIVPICLVAAVLLAGFTTSAIAATAASQQQAMQVALQQSGGSGKVLSVKTETDKNGQVVFLVKVLSNGRVRIVRVNRSQ